MSFGVEGIKCWAGLRRQMPSIQLERSFGLTVSPRFRQDLSKLCLPTHSHQTFVAAPDVRCRARRNKCNIHRFPNKSLYRSDSIRSPHPASVLRRDSVRLYQRCCLAGIRQVFQRRAAPEPIWLTTYGRGQLDSAKRMRVAAVTATTKTNRIAKERIDSQKAAMESPSVDQPKPNMPRQPA